MKIYIIGWNNPTYIEHMYVFYYEFKKRGWDPHLINTDHDVSVMNDSLFFGIFIAKQNMPKNYILYQMEEINIWCDDHDYIKRIMNANEVWNYGKEDLELIRDKYNKNVKHVPLGYSKTYEIMFEKNIKNYIPLGKDIDVLFYGEVTERRMRILNELHKRGIKIYCPNIEYQKKIYFYGPSRDTLIKRSKIILSIYRDSDDADIEIASNKRNFDHARVVHLISNKCFVIHESAHPDKLENGQEYKIPVIPFRNISDVIKHYLENDDERQMVIDRSYDNLKNNVKMSVPLKNYSNTCTKTYKVSQTDTMIDDEKICIHYNHQTSGLGVEKFVPSQKDMSYC